MTKRPDGRYMIQVDVGRDPTTGKRVRKTVYGKTKKEVEEKKRQIMLELSSGMDLRTKMPTVSEWTDKYISVYCKNDTVRMANLHGRDAARIKQYFGATPLDEVRKTDVVSFASTLADYSSSYTGGVRTLLSNIFKAAIDDRILARNPVDGVQFPHAEAGTHRALTEEEIATINRVWSVAREGIGTLVMLYCGLRIGEYLALQWKHVDFARSVINIEHTMKYINGKTIIGTTKTKSSVRTVPVPPSLLRILKLYVSDPEHYLHTIDGTCGEFPCMFSRFTAFFKTVGLPIRAHDLRHTYATMLYEAGVDIKAAQAMLGHATPQMTMDVYTHLTEKKQAESMAKLTNYLTESYTISTMQSV